jgi:hypothetical protein
MATFKVGARVRVVATTPDATASDLVGREGTIVAIPSALPSGDCDVVVDGYDYSQWALPSTSARYYHLAPLVDPDWAAADAFLEKLRKLGSEPVTLTHKQMNEVRGY